MKQGIRMIKEKMEMVEKAVKMKSHYVLLEIYAGTATLTRIARKRDGWEALDPSGLGFWR